MNRDLEETLNELGPEYRLVVARLRSTGRHRRLMPYLTAASGLVLLGLAAPFFTFSFSPHPSSPLYGAREYKASVSEMIATQNPDGSWKNDFLTRRNAAALKDSDDPMALIAYKKAVRNLRARGVL